MACITEMSPISRRQFLSAVAISAVTFALPNPVLALAVQQVPRSLSFFHTHTGEKLDIHYGGPGRYDTKKLAEIDQFLKDFRTGEVYPIDPHLLDQLASISHTFGSRGTFEVISGFRSPKTNQQLRNNSTNVAKRSLHMKGQAIDIRLTGVQTQKLQQCALQLQCGGVGYYPKSDFIHLDTGRIRFW
jgi:uncharacterized protein YcbK (DUF882 family)